MLDRHRDVALFRYSLIRPALDEDLTTRQRGRLVRHLAGVDHLDPNGERVRVGRSTIDRWIRAYRAGGFDALAPTGRTAEPRTPAGLLSLAEALKRENPDRTAAQVRRIIHAEQGRSPSERTVQRHFARVGLNVRPDGQPAETFGRFEAEHTNDLWTGDALHGQVIANHKTYLLAFLDDHSRLVPGHRWTHAEDTVRLEAALRSGMASRGIPKAVYLDNGSAMVSKQLLRACAVLGIRLIHSTVRRPEGRGKIERFFRTVRDEFLVELATSPVADLGELNRLFTAWLEVVYHQRAHSETGQAPIDRFDKKKLRLPTGEQLREAFLWSETRTVTKTATVSLHSNDYQVDAVLVGQKVELVFDPFDLTDIEVRLDGRPMGAAVPHRIGRHSHPAARPDPAQQPPPPSTGIDYLRLIEAQQERDVAARGGLDYSALAGGDHEQLALPEEFLWQPKTTDPEEGAR